MPYRTFVPELNLYREGADVVLETTTLVPSGHFSAKAPMLGAPEGYSLTPEVFPVVLPLGYTPLPSSEAYKLVSHDRITLAGMDHTHTTVLCFLTLNDTVLGQATIGNPGFAGSSLLPITPYRADAKSAVMQSEWIAWVDNKPLSPRALHVLGRIMVPNPGVIASLVPYEGGGGNDDKLRLDLGFEQMPGVWAQVVVSREVRYDLSGYNADHKIVQVRRPSGLKEVIEIEDLS